MSRHRDVRCMNYSDEYDGYDDVYGHSVEDDYCVSPSVEQFLFDRSKQQNIASFITEPDIVEDNEDVDENAVPPMQAKTELSQFEMAKLISCIESIRSVIGESIPESFLKEEIIKSGFNTEVALNALLEKSIKKTSGKAAVNKDRVDTHPGASVKQSNTFTIPKLTFKKRQEAQQETTSMSFFNNIRSLQNSINNSSPAYSSLADMITDRSKTMSSSQASFPNNENSSSFSSLADLTLHHLQTSNSPSNDKTSSTFTSLADLTAHHLKNTSNLTNPIESTIKLNSPNTNFVIPKLLIQKNRQIPMHNSDEVDMSTEQDDLLSSIQKRLSAVHVLPVSENMNFNYPSKNSENTPVNDIIDTMKPPSPDSWIIDLSTALKEAESLDSSDLIKENSIPSSNLQYDLSFESNSPSALSQSFMMYPPVDIKCIFNMKSLRNAKLPYVAKTASAFGTVLCRKWKIRKIPIKCQQEQYNTVVRFDFSTPYSRK